MANGLSYIPAYRMDNQARPPVRRRDEDGVEIAPIARGRRTFWLIGFAVALPIAGRWGHEAVYHGLNVSELKAPAAGLVAVQLLLALAPLLVFGPRLRAVRRRGLADYGALLAEHGRRVERRWIQRQIVPDDEGLLSAPEIGPVADTVSLYQAVASMRTSPLGRQSLLPIALASVLPLVPVFATQIPLKQIAAKLLAPLVGL